MQRAVPAVVGQALALHIHRVAPAAIVRQPQPDQS